MKVVLFAGAGLLVALGLAKLLKKRRGADVWHEVTNH
ncbi:hypothetical protein Br6_03949 [Rhodococcus sp. Br-6]|jgi:hypothetical protein|uniref:Secreted protein n=1 Tax=Rhodococcus hoagii (strain 103S) TaxID=685727 RepID=A0A3S5Y0W9_RHOH1|nr:hypothetical protein H849_00085 [Prescottella equi NBRC 101255 = C 7]GBF16553.1 hypothetical protein Br6_03949 [Rhodococcus sp. Br-6]CBH46173.1 putative secreted protein [Prescottella equi 103S]SUE02197.1 Uncharacterised protein [Prescottella equi]SUE21228.1 Uncharacterised protein [Prescottella equi]